MMMITTMTTMMMIMMNDGRCVQTSISQIDQEADRGEDDEEEWSTPSGGL